MDLLKIGTRTVNLDRLSVIEEGSGGHTLKLQFGDVTLELDERESERFRDFIASNFQVRELVEPSKKARAGRIVRRKPPGDDRNVKGRPVPRE